MARTRTIKDAAKVGTLRKSAISRAVSKAIEQRFQSRRGLVVPDRIKVKTARTGKKAL